MALVTVPFQSKNPFSTYACQEVAVCLTDAWAAQTVSGVAIVFATLENSGRYLGRGYEDLELLNPRGVELYQYALTFDDAQFAIDGGTGLPYVITCDAVVDITSNACFWHKFVDFASA